jgi:hypothetical protein
MSIGLLVTILNYTVVYARLEFSVDTTVVQPGNGQHASNVAVFGGVGSVLLTAISTFVTGGTARVNGTGIFAFGIIAGVAAVVSGILGLTNRWKWLSSGKPFKDKFQENAISGKSVLGIVLGLLSIGVSVFLILIKTGVMGFI